MEIKHNDRVFVLGLAGKDELEEVKGVDDRAFGSHHGVTMEELEQILRYGKILTLREKDSGILVGEAQVLFEKIPELPCTLGPNVGYCYGIGIRPEFQGQGFGKVLMKAHDRCAYEAGCKETLLTVRIENYPSIRLMMGTGYHIYGYDPTFYGSNLETDSRILMKRHLNGNGNGEKVFLRGPVFVPVVFGDEHDPPAHESVSSLVENNHIGKKIDRQGLYFYGT